MNRSRDWLTCGCALPALMFAALAWGQSAAGHPAREAGRKAPVTMERTPIRPSSMSRTGKPASEIHRPPARVASELGRVVVRPASGGRINPPVIGGPMGVKKPVVNALDGSRMPRKR